MRVLSRNMVETNHAPDADRSHRASVLGSNSLRRCSSRLGGSCSARAAPVRRYAVERACTHGQRQAKGMAMEHSGSGGLRPCSRDANTHGAGRESRGRVVEADILSDGRLWVAPSRTEGREAPSDRTDYCTGRAGAIAYVVRR